MFYMLRAKFFITEKWKGKGIIKQTALIRRKADGLKCTGLHQTEDKVRCCVAADGLRFLNGFVINLWLWLRVSSSCGFNHHRTFSDEESSCSF